MQEMESLAHLQQLQVQTLQSLMALTQKNSEVTKHNASEGLQPLMKLWTDFLDQAKQNDFLKQAEEYQKQMQDTYMSFFKQGK